MKKIRIFDIISSFNDLEISEFKKFIASDYFRGSRDYSQLLCAILSYYPEFNTKSISLEQIYAKAYPGKIFNNRVIISRLSEMNKLAEEYLIHKRLRCMTEKRNEILIEELTSRKLFNFGDNLANKRLKEIKSKKFIDEDDLEHIDKYISKKIEINVSKDKYNNMHSLLLDNISIFLTLTSIHLLTMKMTLKNVFEYHPVSVNYSYLTEIYNRINFKEIIEILNKRYPDYSTQLSLAYYSYLISLEGNRDNDYYSFKKLFYDNISNMGLSTRHDFFSKLYYYCVKQLNSGREQFQRETYNVTKDIIANKAYNRNEGEYFPVFLFREFVTSALKHKEFDTVESFINDNHRKLPPKEMQPLYFFALGRLYFAKNEFNKSVTFLSAAEPSQPIIRLDAKIFLLASYYETANIEEAYLCIDNIKHYIKSTIQIPAIQVSSAKVFVKIMEKILALKTNPNRNKLAELNTFVDRQTNLTLKPWVLIKIEELLSS